MGFELLDRHPVVEYKKAIDTTILIVFIGLPGLKTLMYILLQVITFFNIYI